MTELSAGTPATALPGLASGFDVFQLREDVVGVLQLNPAYKPGQVLADLAPVGEIAPETARFFGPGLRPVSSVDGG